MALVQPAPEHTRLATLLGTWDVEITMWSWPSLDSAKAVAVAENQMILGGRFLESRVKGGAPPMEIELFELTGFDRRYNRYTTIRFDSWGTYYVTAAGGMTDNLVKMQGTDTDPNSGHRSYDMNLRFVDAGTYVTDVTFTSADIAPGSAPFKAFEAVYRRRK